MTDESTTPYFARNRDETDVAYERGWDDAGRDTKGRQYGPYRPGSTMAKAYWDGYRARRFSDEAGRESPDAV